MGIVGQMMDYAEQLEAVHQHIEEKRIPVVSEDNLAAQIIELERYLGISDFSALCARKRIAISLFVIASLPVMFYALIIGMDHYLGYQFLGINEKQFTLTLFTFLMHNLPVAGAYFMLFTGSLGYLYWLNRRIGGKIEHTIQQFMLQTRG